MIADEALIASAPHQLEPATPDELAGALKWASESRLPTVIRGGGSKIGWGRIPPRVDVVVSTRRLNQVVAHRHGDLTGTFQAGARLRDVNAALGAHRQWLPIDSPFADATIGGIVATNDSGPLRHRYGTARDLLIGVTLALTDGRIVKAGGHVVKNVAGYDLGRLMSGSFGTLAAVVDATFKLSPLWPVSQTVVAELDDDALLGKSVDALRGSQLEPVACDLHSVIDAGRRRHRLMVRFATSPAATEAQVAAARGLLPAPAAVVTGADEATVWQTQLETAWRGNGAVVRASWLPANLSAALEALRSARAAATIELAARCGVGAGVLRIDGDESVQARAIAALKEAPALGHVTVLRASPALKERIDVWPAAADSARVLAAIKQSLDPAGILNAGRGPV